MTNANSPLASDAPVTTQQPGLVMNYYIATSGIFPSEGETGNSSDQMTSYLGQIIACAENINDPNGWALCDGQLLPINQNQALFSLLGTTYGGDGVTTFALPNLQGRTVLGTGGSNGLGAEGQVSGANTINLTSANLPALSAPTIALADETGAPGAPGHTTDGQMNVSGVATGAAWSYSTDGDATFTTGAGTSFTLTGDGVKAVLVNQSWGSGDVSPNASLTFTLDPSILFQNTGGQAAIWEMNGVSLVGSALLGANPGPNWTAVGTGDFNDDGQPDILLQNMNGQVAVWETNGANVTSSALVANPGPSWKAVGTGDFDGDHHSDILLQNTNGNVAIWDMNGTSLTGSAVVANPGPNWKAVGTGDFDDDGHSDILLQNTNGNVAIWEMNGTEIKSSAAVANPEANWKVIGTGDFNGDSHSDILLQNTNGNVAVWDMNGAQIMSSAAVANPGANWHAIGTNGGSDILLQSTSGQTALWDMTGTQLTGSGTVSVNAGPNWRAVGLVDDGFSSARGGYA